MMNTDFGLLETPMGSHTQDLVLANSSCDLQLSRKVLVMLAFLLLGGTMKAQNSILLELRLQLVSFLAALCARLSFSLCGLAVCL
jgi:hypothetical protein